MNKQRMIRVKPYSSDLSNNEHWIYASGDGLEESAREMMWEVENRFKEIFPDGSGRGDRFEIYHSPTADELQRLRALATELDATFESEIRSEEAYQEMRGRRDYR